MYYGDKREAMVNIMKELISQGWKVYGFRADESDSMTDYYSPAYWDGIATKNGYTLLIDQYDTHRSGYEKKEYDYSKMGKANNANEKVIKLTAKMLDDASTPNEKAACAILIEKEAEKGNIKPSYIVLETYPTFVHPNPKSCSWHIEKNEQIVAKGTGVFACYVCNDHHEPEKSERIAKVSAMVKRFEMAIKQDNALESEVIKVPVTVIKEVETEQKVLTDSDFKESLKFVFKVGYTHGNSKGTKYEFSVNESSGGWYTFYKIGRSGKASKSLANRYSNSLEVFNSRLAKGHIAIIESIEVIEYIEKVVYSKTAKKVKQDLELPTLTGEVVEASEVAETVTESVNEVVSSNEDQATKRQLWALHCATKLNTTTLKISKEKASELIAISKAGTDITNIIKSMLGLTVEVTQETKTPITEEVIECQQLTKHELENYSDKIFEVSADLLTDNWSHDPIHPITEDQINEYKTKLFEGLIKSECLVNEQIIKYIKSQVRNTFIVEALEQFNVSHNSDTITEPTAKATITDQSSIIPKIEKQIVSAQTKLNSLSGNYQTNTWKRSNEEASREMKRDALRFEIALLEYLIEKASENSMTTLEQSLLVGSIREDLKNYHSQKFKYNHEVKYPIIETSYDLNGWYNLSVPKQQKRLLKVNITNNSQLHAAIEEYHVILSNIDKPKNPIEQKIKKLVSDIKFVKIDGYFPTPKTIVEQLINLADITDGETILEPSAGHGSILDGITAHLHDNSITASVEGIEQNHSLRDILELKNYKMVGNDFLEYSKYNHYNKIIMNPPFEKNQDIDHVLHAFKCLKNNGRIVAIMSTHFTFANDSKSVSFREWLSGVGYYEKLPEGSFKDSGTGVNTVIVVIDKMEQQTQQAI